VASEAITILDDPTLPGRRGSYRFDDEGTPAGPTLLVERGVLRGLLHSRATALDMGCAPDGHGRRESFRHSPIPRMANTFIAPGALPPEAVLRATPRGLYVTRMGGGEVDTLSGDFVFEVAEGFRIEGGEVAEPLRGATLVGNGPAVLAAIDLVGSDLGFSLGTCGKDGQAAPVADAQPTLRIPEIVVGGAVE
jgi:TldD protein